MNIQKWLFLLLLLSPTHAIATGSEWNGVGVIKTMFIYPTYAVIVQGNTWQGSAGCTNNDRWSFNWSQFDLATQARIQSMLLSAYVSKTPIQVAIHQTGYGPEGRKNFNGQIMLP